jgi:hypothetical protein
MDNLEKPDHVQVVILCDICQELSEDLICSNCGNLLLEISNEESGSAFSSQPSIQTPIQEDELSKHKPSNIQDQENPSQHKPDRKREVNSLGMYLQEKKQKLTMNNKLDLDAAFSSWRKLSEEEKAKYKQMSIEDRNKLNSQAVKEKSSDVSQNNIEKKRAKNVQDAKAKAIKRKQVDHLKEDVNASRTLLNSMIAGKKEALANIEEDVVACNKELDNLSREIVVSVKLKNVKKDNLEVLKKEYKELFARHKLCVKMN